MDIRLFEHKSQGRINYYTSSLVKESSPVLQDFYCDQKYNQRWKRTAVIYSEKGTHVVIKHHQRQVKEEPGQRLHYTFMERWAVAKAHILVDFYEDIMDLYYKHLISSHPGLVEDGYIIPLT
ncbi:uncharacterized protein BX664DRAFT_360115 [Halteromyces radiatus]|uniref:uncharacterized protein n=1 Tax=Halteromyces radiatus TaxID=101107 RepID=UPI002220E721|nr:uncharacterized protein BX664DRAFT_360115 [Halteromyces radiatus]KAI8086598.1 hypothetical protein BX664DRAFT_360115 [Halteromyces radiatus]